MKNNNKDLIQSYILTSARYTFSVPEKRILYGIIELMQFYTEGKTLDKRYNITKTIFDDVDIVRIEQSHDLEQCARSVLKRNAQTRQPSRAGEIAQQNIGEQPCVDITAAQHDTDIFASE